MLSDKILGRYEPLIVQFNVTDRCNSSCRYCYATYYARGQAEMSTEQVFSIIDCLARRGARRINLSGGEPLIREDIGKIIRRVKSYGMECVMNTNGLLIPEKIDDVRELDVVSISLDGDREAHDANRGRGSFDKVMAAIDCVNENNIPLQVSVTLTKQNIGSISFLNDLAKERGFNVWFSPLIKQKNQINDHISDCYCSDEEYRGALAGLDGVGYRLSANWPYPYHDNRVGVEVRGYPRCYAGKYFILIDSNGDIYPCCQTINEMKVKNIFKDGFDEAYKAINNHGCRNCSIPFNIELNRALSLDVKCAVHLLSIYCFRGKNQGINVKKK